MSDFIIKQKYRLAFTSQLAYLKESMKIPEADLQYAPGFRWDHKPLATRNIISNCQPFVVFKK
jgi:hypothetical protein